jgi:hypothetical protein
MKSAKEMPYSDINLPGPSSRVKRNGNKELIAQSNTDIFKQREESLEP